jgi:hypothetical protein
VVAPEAWPGEEVGWPAFVNVRMYRISDSDEVLMDTLGLSTLLLPDLQVRYCGLDPQEVAQKLYSAAAYLLERGDVLDDGSTVGGLPVGTSWRCKKETSMMLPSRPVVTLQAAPA